jgi:hypothetical protein
MTPTEHDALARALDAEAMRGYELDAQTKKRMARAMADEMRMNWQSDGDVIESLGRIAATAYIEGINAAALRAPEPVQQEHESRSILRRVAAQKGEPAPDFSAAVQQGFVRVPVPTLNALLEMSIFMPREPEEEGESQLAWQRMDAACAETLRLLAAAPDAKPQGEKKL